MFWLMIIAQNSSAMTEQPEKTSLWVTICQNPFTITFIALTSNVLLWKSDEEPNLNVMKS